MIEALEADHITATQRKLQQQFIAGRRRIFEARIKFPPPPEPEPEPPPPPPPEPPPPKLAGSDTPLEYRAHHMPLNLTRIIKHKVAKRFDIPISVMESDARKEPMVLPRHVAIYLCSVVGRFSMPTIGRAFHRDHTSILHATRRIPQRMAASPVLTAIVNDLQRELESEISAWRAAR